MIHLQRYIFFICLICFSCKSDDKDILYPDFKNPPDYTKPWVYWYWIDENISKDGITKDLEAMAQVGIGQALIGHISPGTKRGPVRMLSEEWWEMVEHAVREGQRTGVDIGFFNGPGWSQSGGPWIRKEQSMRYIVSREYKVSGPGRFEKELSYPDSLFEPLALQAIPIIRNHKINILSTSTNHPQTRTGNLLDNNTETIFYFGDQLKNGDKQWIDINFNNEETLQSITFAFLPVPFSMNVHVQSIGMNGDPHTLRSFKLDRRNINFEIGPKRFDPVTFSIPPTKTDRLRIEFSNLFSHPGAGLKDIHLLSSPTVDQHIEKQLGKMHSDPLPPWDAYVWESQTEPLSEYLILPENIIDLTDFIEEDGRIDWEVPEGDWVILYSGMIPTGATNVPVPPEARGYECDKFTEDAVETHFNSFLGKFLEKVPPENRRSLKTVVIDSYEVGPQNWSNDLKNIFEARYGYDPISWLPVLSGRIIKSADLSNRFLWDIRRLGADLIANRYVKRLRELSNEAGLDLWLENYGHWGFPAEFLQYGGQADLVSGEFWYENHLWDLGPMECRAASSAAHTYGKNKVFAEAFTAGFSFRQYPAVMKTRGDELFCEGINHFVLHLYIHQPWEDKTPGVTAWFGMSYQRHNTWFDQSRDWIKYLQRCHFMLQQGRPVADIAYYIGEDAPKMTGILYPPLPQGYDYDFINADILLNRIDVKNGKLILPDGKSYHLLVLPPQKTMRPEVLNKIRELLEKGAIITGPPPERSPSMREYPEADKRIQKIAGELWNGLNGKSKISTQIGNGRLYLTNDLKTIFKESVLLPDVICEDTTIRWTHRKLNEEDIYFISNQEMKSKTIPISFRIRDQIPELWHPDSGERTHPGEYQTSNSRTHLSLQLEPAGSVFVVFRQRSDLSKPEKVKTTSDLIAVNGPWKVCFPPDWDAPANTVFDSLFSWTDHTIPGIKYFSGTASYKNSFNLDNELINKGTDVILDLGEVNMMAEVILNDTNLGVLWKFPYKADISDHIQAGENDLELRVTNTWWNRLIGDERYPEGFPVSDLQKPRTFTTNKAWNADDELMPAGLLGPVRIVLSEAGS